jgi:hypothetical protein
LIESTRTPTAQAGIRSLRCERSQGSSPQR